MLFFFQKYIIKISLHDVIVILIFIYYLHSSDVQHRSISISLIDTWYTKFHYLNCSRRTRFLFRIAHWGNGCGNIRTNKKICSTFRIQIRKKFLVIVFTHELLNKESKIVQSWNIDFSIEVNPLSKGRKVVMFSDAIWG